MIRVELQLLVGIFQRHVVTDLTVTGGLVKVGDPVGLVLCLDGRQKSGRQLCGENVAHRCGGCAFTGSCCVGTGSVFGPGDRDPEY